MEALRGGERRRNGAMALKGDSDVRGRKRRPKGSGPVRARRRLGREGEKREKMGFGLFPVFLPLQFFFFPGNKRERREDGKIIGRVFIFFPKNIL